MNFSSIEEVRNRIDQIDSELVKMIAHAVIVLKLQLLSKVTIQPCVLQTAFSRSSIR